MEHLAAIKSLLVDVLALDTDPSALTASTPLLGNFPELDSMAVVGLVSRIEEHFGIEVEDDEISAATFESVGTLSAFVESKTAGR